MTKYVQYILIFVILLLIDSITVASRSVFLHTSLGRLIPQGNQKAVSTHRVLQLIYSIPHLKTSLHLVLTLERLLFGGVLVIFLAQLSPAPVLWTFMVCLVLAAVLLFLLGCWMEAYVNRNPAIWAIRLAFYVKALAFGTKPFIRLLPSSWLSPEVDPSESGSLLTEELKTLVDAGEQEGALEEGERKMISSIFDLENTLTREIMVPRIDVLALDITTSIPQAIDAFLETGHSRVPVYEGTIDNILGLLYAKDLLRVRREDNPTARLNDLLRPAYFVPEAKKVTELLAELQERRVHMAIVVDEYGGVAGLVTLEDIVEEILGEIQDEYDQAEESPYQQINEHEYLFQGGVDLDDLNDLLGCHLPKEEADTLGGYIYSAIGRVPIGGETIRVGDLILTVETVVGRRIRKVRAQRIISSHQGEGKS